MGVYTRKDSLYWWMHVETAPAGQQKVSTKIRIGHTAAERKESRDRAVTMYHERCLAPTKEPQEITTDSAEDGETFGTFLTWYDAHVIEHHKGAERERSTVVILRAAFGDLTLTDPDWKTKAIEWRTMRRATGTLIKHFGGPRGKPRQLKPPSANTVNREFAVLQSVFTSAVACGKLAASPLYGIPDLKTVKPLRRLMTDPEEAKIAAELSPEDRAIFYVGLDALVRLTDILDLRRTDDHGTDLDVRDPKNGEPLSVPVSTRLRAALDALPIRRCHECVEATTARAKCAACATLKEWYFPGRRGAETERDRRGGYAKALQRACERAGVPYGRRLRGITFHHATRRTGATRMIRRGGEKAIAVVQRVGGWKQPDVLLEIYQETTTDEMRAAVESVSAGMPPAPPPPPKFRLVKRPVATKTGDQS